ncbi:cytochrome b [Pseudokordiimonas caeni]|uniref:cytochrome b n=1 Tax=Pseudokordiimonas caeni TaxID=2997908 RepID=UPI002811FBBA|nr:cytochrome b [Pseudokordiimonas caeni]
MTEEQQGTQVTSYNATAKGLHWIAVLLILGLSIVGLYFSDLPRGDEKTALRNMHASTGLLLLFLMVVRLGWRVRSGRPADLETTTPLQAKIAHGMHHLLYLNVFVLIGAGMMSILTTATPVPFFGLFEIPSPFERDMDLHHLYEEIHEGAWIALMVLVGLHIVAALYHAFVQKDATLRRMWFSKKS